MFNGLIGAMPSASALGSAKGAMDALPVVVEALGRLPAIVREMPPAPVVLGALSRIVADAIAGELARLGPSDAFRSIAASHGVADVDGLYAAFVAEVRR